MIVPLSGTHAGTLLYIFKASKLNYFGNVEGKEVIGGYWIIEAKDLADANGLCALTCLFAVTVRASARVAWILPVATALGLGGRHGRVA